MTIATLPRSRGAGAPIGEVAWLAREDGAVTRHSWARPPCGGAIGAMRCEQTTDARVPSFDLHHLESHRAVFGGSQPARADNDDLAAVRRFRTIRGPKPTAL